jgi:cell division protease FtsH
VHAKNVKLDRPPICRDRSRHPWLFRRGTRQSSNEAALLAARTGKKAVGMVELEEARDKVRWGRERRSMAMTDEDKKFTAGTKPVTPSST